MAPDHRVIAVKQLKFRESVMLAGMDAANPYAPPRAPLADTRPRVDPEPDLPAWRLEGATLLVRHGATLPDVCLFTGEPTTPAQRLELPLSWTPVWFRIAAVLFPMLVLVAYSTMRKTSNVEGGLGPAGRKRRRLGALLTLGAVIDTIALLLVIAGRDEGDSLALVGFLFVGVRGAVVRRVVRAGFSRRPRSIATTRTWGFASRSAGVRALAPAAVARRSSAVRTTARRRP